MIICNGAVTATLHFIQDRPQAALQPLAVMLRQRFELARCRLELMRGRVPAEGRVPGGPARLLAGSRLAIADGAPRDFADRHLERS